MTSSVRIYRDDDGGAMNPPAKNALPDLDTMAIVQSEQARNRMELDTSDFPGFKRVRKLRELVGPFTPESLILVGGRQENGKSLLAQNLADDLLEQQVPTLYMGLEQAPHELRIKHACLRKGVHPSAILRPSDEFKRSAEYDAIHDAVWSEVAWLESPIVRNLLIFCPVERVNRAVLEQWTTGAVKQWGVQCVIVDHIDHMDHGTGFNAVHELTETVHLAKALARRHEIAIVALSQIRRAGDLLNVYTPPQAHEYAGTSAKERTADVMLSIWRPLRTDKSPKELRQLMEDTRIGGYKPNGTETVYRQGVMGVRKVKDRLGEIPGEQVMLHVVKGRLEDPPSPYGAPYGGQS